MKIMLQYCHVCIVFGVKFDIKGCCQLLELALDRDRNLGIRLRYTQDCFDFREPPTEYDRGSQQRKEIPKRTSLN